MGWFPPGPEESPGWRLDVVTLLAVIGESSVAEHSQAITATLLCLLPRILPAPQALLKPTRPARMPEATAKMAGVYGGVVLDSVGYFATIIQPLDELPAFAFKVIEIRHRDVKGAGGPVVAPSAPGADGAGSSDGGDVEKGGARRPGAQAADRGVAFSTGGDAELGGGGVTRRRTTQKAADYLANPTLASSGARRPAVPPQFWSPVHVLSVASFLLTLGLLAAAGHWRDGAAAVAIGTISLASSVVGYASWWRPVLASRSDAGAAPRGDVVVRTREGAFLVVRCSEEVARELYAGTDECAYRAGPRLHRALMGLGTLLLMAGVALLGNCSFRMQVALGVSYAVLNALYWAMGLLSDRCFWDLGRYEWRDATPDDARGAGGGAADPREGYASYTRTLWYAIRETGQVGWVERSGAAPGTEQWKKWLAEAERAARDRRRDWPAVGRKDDIMREAVAGGGGGGGGGGAGGPDSAQQHAPLTEVQPRPSARRVDRF